MGEEEKKGDEKKVEGKKAAAAEQVKKPEEEKKGQEEKTGDEKKETEKKTEEGKDSKDQPPASPPPPPEIVLRVYMHCEGCARKVKKSLKGFNGVEDVITDCKTQKVVVKGEKADPIKVLERVKRKTHRQVDLLSPIPKPPEEEAKKPEEKEPVKVEEKKEEPKVITVVLKVHMHCEACAQEIKKRIERMKEVEVATPDLKNSQVTVKGTFDPQKLVDYVYKRTGKQAVVVKQDPPPAAENKEGEKAKEGKDEKKGENGEEKKGTEKGDPAKKEGDGSEEAAADLEEAKMIELRRNEFYYYPPRYAMDMYAYPPQIFSDENPNACSIM
ncbi:hypothetical protein Nepgr_002973 [Nepenthes gracilis]|uniref:HMA domain-containing protein n=1 Tax=Nepenthes gracilis TaxID=150966 RepID=A0AAD3RYM9_NEPGR|nr:hypothetical protein Nepgr_002973 [Nepenthes gracilis]